MTRTRNLTLIVFVTFQAVILLAMMVTGDEDDSLHPEKITFVDFILQNNDDSLHLPQMPMNENIDPHNYLRGEQQRKQGERRQKQQHQTTEKIKRRGTIKLVTDEKPFESDTHFEFTFLDTSHLGDLIEDDEIELLDMTTSSSASSSTSKLRSSPNANYADVRHDARPGGGKSLIFRKKNNLTQDQLLLPSYNKNNDTIDMNTTQRKIFVGNTFDETSLLTLVTTQPDPENNNTFIVAGSIVNDVDGTITKISTRFDGKVVTKVLKENEMKEEAEPVVDDKEILDEDGVRKLRIKALERRKLEGGDDNDDITIDVLIIYSLKAMCSEANLPHPCLDTPSNRLPIETKIDVGFVETNLAFRNSGLSNIRIRKVHSHLDVNVRDFEDGTSTMMPYNQMLLEMSRGRNDFSYIPEMRNEHGGDFVHLVVGDSGPYCGIGRLGPGAENVYSISHYDCFTGYYTFAHELGHNMGCLHDRSNSSPHPYSHAYQDPNNIFRTILAYNCPNGGCTRRPYFSSSDPTQSFRGFPTGSPDHDNARLIRENALLISQYRQSVVTHVPTLSPVSLAPTSVRSEVMSPMISMGVQNFYRVRGVMFEVVARNPVSIVNFYFSMYNEGAGGSGSFDIEIWTKDGGLLQPSPMTGTQQGSLWTKIGITSVHRTKEKNTQPDSPVSLSLNLLPRDSFIPQVIKCGESRSFYIKMVTANYHFLSTGGNDFGALYFGDENVSIMEGVGKEGDAFNSTTYGGGFGGLDASFRFEGGVIYSKASGDCGTATFSANNIISSTANLAQLQIPFSATYGYYLMNGFMFDCYAKQTSNVITIRNFKVHTYSSPINNFYKNPIQLLIYTKSGSYADDATGVVANIDQSRWDFVASVEIEAGRRMGLLPRELPPITIQPGGVQAFYIYTKDDFLIGTKGFGERVVLGGGSSSSSKSVVSDNSLEIKEGVGLSREFGGVYPGSYNFNCTLLYNSVPADDGTTEKTTEVPSAAPTSLTTQPSALPTFIPVPNSGKEERDILEIKTPYSTSGYYIFNGISFHVQASNSKPITLHNIKVNAYKSNHPHTFRMFIRRYGANNQGLKPQIQMNSNYWTLVAEGTIGKSSGYGQYSDFISPFDPITLHVGETVGVYLTMDGNSRLMGTKACCGMLPGMVRVDVIDGITDKDENYLSLFHGRGSSKAFGLPYDGTFDFSGSLLYSVDSE